ncbi:ATP-dependent DNA helicase RecG [Legionella geestiana]|uniref:ATP-dependent DNA helicase RecG n=1 Tax=Legionella geestiana TaxID=45065 RepID=UPI001092B609|nr:ATP-dependent DNA helicase RecG [Legionella geestiana]QDQ39281.1 ATP-dependent DNA helicase RecG [Legionella geestiana]
MISTLSATRTLVLTHPCQKLPGVGKVLAAKLARCGLNTLQDLLFHLPCRYQDRTRITPIADARANEWCVVAGRIAKTEIRRGRRPMLLCHVEDGSGLLTLQFFHFNKAQAARLGEGGRIRAFGEVRIKTHLPSMIHPEYRLLDDEAPCEVEETLTPIYPSTEGLSQTRLRQLVRLALLHTGEHLQSLEWMSAEALRELGLWRLDDALNLLHAPMPDTPLQSLEEGTHPAMTRLAFDELLAQRLCMQFARERRSQSEAAPIVGDNTLTVPFLAGLPFRPTPAQTRVSDEIAVDLARSRPMLRLVQGDVGAGKTLVAALAALKAIEAGHQVAFMAPTDLLSEQHARTFAAWFTPLGITTVRLTGKMKASEKRHALELLASHGAAFAVGTHALFQEDVHFARLSLVIIDEQHRFGVEQRLQLHEKGCRDARVAHQLLMTATPIPRTLAMTHFAHLDVSTLDGLPPGRTPVTTAVLPQTRREPLVERLRTAIADGRQIYWVCTLIEESETLQCATATETAELLQSLLPEARVGLVHGRMKAAEKDAVMQAFKEGSLHLLVATTVIEVGVDVPNASVMVIENAERLGLAQLHQLRGRVGRGGTQSHCLLLYQPPLSPQGKTRLQTLRDTTDGFVIAEQDLLLRGSGEFLGTRQSGYNRCRIARFPRDAALIEKVAPLASKMVEEQSEIAKTLTRRWFGEQAEMFLQS